LENAESKALENQQGGEEQPSGIAGTNMAEQSQSAAEQARMSVSGGDDPQAGAHNHAHTHENAGAGHDDAQGENHAHDEAGHEHNEAGQAHDHEHPHGDAGHRGPQIPPMDPACKREIEVEIPAQVVTRQRELLVQQYAKQARVPGFRKGKVPASLISNKFNDEITSDVVEQLVPQYYQQEVLKGGFRPVSQPHIYNLEFTPGEPMKFKAAFEVLPEFELSDYAGLKVERPEIKVSDEEVDAEIKQLQERQASFDPVNEERGAEKGDWVQVSFEAMPAGQEDAAAEQESKDAGAGDAGEGAAGKHESKAAAAGQGEEAQAQPVHMDEVLVEIGGANTIPEFTEHLAGAKAGEERSFAVNYPEDFYDKRLAGQKFNYKVKINAIKNKAVPELNDDFAKELSTEFQSLGDLKQRIRENMEAERRHTAEHEVKGKLIDELLAKHDFPVPRSLVEHQIDLRLERGLRALAAQGMKTEDMRKMDFGRLRAGQLEAATKEVKSNVLLAKIALKEKIQVSDEELEQEIGAMAQQMQQPVEEVKKRLMQDNAVERLKDRMRTEKALNFLYEKAG
jgi:trigger factor